MEHNPTIFISLGCEKVEFACSTLNQLIFDRLLKHYHRRLFSYFALYGDMGLIVKIYDRFNDKIKEIIEYN